MLDELLKVLGNLIPLLSHYPKWVQIFFAAVFIQALIAIGIFVLYYGTATELQQIKLRKETNFEVILPTDGEFITVQKYLIKGTGTDPALHNSLSVKTLHIDSGQEKKQTGELVVGSDGTWSFEYCELEQVGQYEIIVDAFFGGRRFNVRKRVNYVELESANSAELAIHITKRYRPRFEFSITGPENGHFLVNRLYLEYVSEFEWEPRPPPIEALMFKTSYGIYLDRQFSQYDLLPLTPDNEAHGFEYKGSESDHFAVELYGTKVSIVRICAEVYDVRKHQSFFLQSEDLKIVAGGNTVPLWDKSIPVEENRLLDHISPATHKMITALNYEELVPNFSPSLLSKAEEELSELIQNLPNGALKNHALEVRQIVRKYAKH